MSKLRLFFAVAILCAAHQTSLMGQSSPWLYFPLGPSGPTLGTTPTVYDPTSNELIVFGGVINPNYNFLNSTWVLPNANGIGGVPSQWQQLAPTGALPPPRYGQSVVYDQVSNRIIIFGGGQGGCVNYCTRFNDVWVISDANGVGGTPSWTQLEPSAPNGPPSIRASSGAIYDPASNRMTIFGGGNNGDEEMNDVWVLTHANGLGGQPEWLPLSPTGTPPAPRESAIVTYDPASNNMTVFGGCCPSQNDVWILSHADGLGGTPAWRELSPAGTLPAPRTSSAYGYDADTNTLLVFGGFGYNPDSTVYNDVWVLTGANGVRGTPAWVNTISNGAPGSPPASAFFPGSYDSISKRLMFAPDASDLWILPTRNGIDFSGANTPTPAQLSGIVQAGIQYAVGEISAGTAPNSAGAAELQAFQNAGFQSAAYCFLALDKTAAPGDQQVNTGITALGGIGSAAFNSLSFIAIDVEEESLDTNGAYDPATLPTRLAIIAEALQQTNWKRKQAAALLGISCKALLYKIRDYGLGEDQGRAGAHVT